MAKLLVFIAGLSGVGKTSVLTKLANSSSRNYIFPVRQITTRKSRPDDDKRLIISGSSICELHHQCSIRSGLYGVSDSDIISFANSKHHQFAIGITGFEEIHLIKKKKFKNTKLSLLGSQLIIKTIVMRYSNCKRREKLCLEAFYGTLRETANHHKRLRENKILLDRYVYDEEYLLKNVDYIVKRRDKCEITALEIAKVLEGIIPSLR